MGREEERRDDHLEGDGLRDGAEEAKVFAAVFCLEPEADETEDRGDHDEDVGSQHVRHEVGLRDLLHVHSHPVARAPLLALEAILILPPHPCLQVAELDQGLEHTDPLREEQREDTPTADPGGSEEEDEVEEYVKEGENGLVPAARIVQGDVEAHNRKDKQELVPHQDPPGPHLRCCLRCRRLSEAPRLSPQDGHQDGVPEEVRGEVVALLLERKAEIRHGASFQVPAT
eukprot:314145-Hanusia_phi.AAC.1